MIELENVVVAPDAAGRGSGRAPTEDCVTRAREAGLREVRLYASEKMTGHLAICPHPGYAETGRRREDGFARVFFTKTL